MAPVVCTGKEIRQGRLYTLARFKRLPRPPISMKKVGNDQRLTTRV
jgi:hypothetical protein